MSKKENDNALQACGPGRVVREAHADLQRKWQLWWEALIDGAAKLSPPTSPLPTQQTDSDNPEAHRATRKKGRKGK